MVLHVSFVLNFQFELLFMIFRPLRFRKMKHYLKLSCDSYNSSPLRSTLKESGSTAAMAAIRGRYFEKRT